jgi:hypothetical protein
MGGNRLSDKDMRKIKESGRPDTPSPMSSAKSARLRKILAIV